MRKCERRIYCRKNQEITENLQSNVTEKEKLQ